MKKIAIFTALLTFAAGTVFAGTIGDQPGQTTATTGVSIVSQDGKAIGKLSAAVGLGWKGDATGYAIDTQHTKGTKAFGTSHDSTAIYSKDVATSGTAVDALGSSNSASFVGSWTAM